jgi:hypothetical protein
VPAPIGPLIDGSVGGHLVAMTVPPLADAAGEQLCVSGAGQSFPTARKLVRFLWVRPPAHAGLTFFLIYGQPRLAPLARACSTRDRARNWKAACYGAGSRKDIALVDRSCYAGRLDLAAGAEVVDVFLHPAACLHNRRLCCLARFVWWVYSVRWHALMTDTPDRSTVVSAYSLRAIAARRKRPRYRPPL